MSTSTEIEWTDATWNPVTGCSKLTHGCDLCYAERFSERFRGVEGHPFQNGFDLTLKPERLSQPLTWRKPRRIFVNSMSDLFHKEIPRDFIDSVFETMEAATWHTFQVLTKRSSLMNRYLHHRYGSGLAPPQRDLAPLLPPFRSAASLGTCQSRSARSEHQIQERHGRSRPRRGGARG
jgi:protein gp37